MPRVSIARTARDDRYPSAGRVVTMTAADTVNKEQTVLTGSEIIIAHNAGATPRNVTITSVADPRTGRVGHITSDPIAAGAIKAYGPLGLAGWRQGDGTVYFEADHADVKFGVLEF